MALTSARIRCPRLLPLVAIGVFMSAGAGCEDRDASAPASTETAGIESANSTADGAAVTAADVQFVDRSAFDSFLAEQEGKVVFVDYWATWCGTCKEQFPHTVELQEKFGEQGLVVVAVSLDDPTDENRQAVVDFLNSKGFASYAFIAQGTDEEDLYETFEIGIAIPHYQLYDQQGQLAQRFVFGDPTASSPTPEEIEQAVAKLLAGDS